jgi:two-component system sensor histidine kinase KdpD
MKQWPDRLDARAFGAERPPLWLGAIVAVAGVAIATALIYPLKVVTPTVSLDVVYLPVVLLASAYWGLALGLATSLASAAAFDFFHIPPVGQFTISAGRDWVALAAFVTVAVVVSTMAQLARNRALDVERGRAEADLAAGLARELLLGTETSVALGATARRVAEALAIPSAAIRVGAAQGGERRQAVALRDREGNQIGTLIVPREVSAEAMQRLRAYVVPALEALVAIALQRDAVQAEAVETAALRRSDELKTALLQAISHDLRTPVTAIVAAGHALSARSLTPEDRTDLSDAVVEEGERLSALIEKLLDLSRLQAGRAEPDKEWTSIEEVLLAARDVQPDGGRNVRLSVDPDLPPLQVDAAQLQHVFANLLENARRYSDDGPVSVRVRRAEGLVVVRVVDQGPGIRRPEQDRIFEAFYRGRQSAVQRWTGSGLGLAIARGFVEANGGSISVESLPGQGASFVVELPLPSDGRMAA